MLKKILVIGGLTSTGKTNLALQLSEKYSGEIVSADSRQVYKNMDIATGKDLPQDANFFSSDINSDFKNIEIGYYLINGIKVWGLDLVNPNYDFSVSDYLYCAEKIIKDIWKRGKSPLLVGGSGFYIKALIDGLDTIKIKPDYSLREKLNDKSSEDLYKILLEINPKKASLANPSERKNKARLIRSIEVSEAINKIIKDDISDINHTRIHYDSLLYIGLFAEKGIMEEKIKQRVLKRISLGFEKEISKLLEDGLSWSYKSLQTMGYQQYKKFLEKKISYQEFIDSWVLEEKKYLKKQMTWFKKDKRINWFDISVEGWEKRVEIMVQNW